MAREYSLLIFDWDGTLIDSEANIVFCMRATIQELDLPDLSASEIRNVIGLGLREAICTLYPAQGEDIHLDFIDRYRYHFLSSDPSTPFAGVDQLLSQLSESNYLMAVATGKGRVGLERALDQTNYRRHFHSTRCADETRSKPHPQMLEEILDELGLEPADALMIGDTEYDLQMAKHIKMDSVGVCTGVHEEARLRNCDPVACLPSALDLIEFLNGENEAQNLQQPARPVL